MWDKGNSGWTLKSEGFTFVCVCFGWGRVGWGKQYYVSTWFFKKIWNHYFQKSSKCSLPAFILLMLFLNDLKIRCKVDVSYFNIYSLESNIPPRQLEYNPNIGKIILIWLDKSVKNPLKLHRSCPWWNVLRFSFFFSLLSFNVGQSWLS